jgi:hypothetical protein
LALLQITASGCDGTLDAGRDAPTSVASPIAADASVPVVGSPSSSVEAGSSSSDEEPPPIAEAGGPSNAEEPLVDAGSETPDSLLPVDARNPIVIVNDHPYDNWSGEYALLSASTGRISLAGIVVNTSEYSPDLDFNQAGWQELIDAARASGLRNVPDLVGGVSEPLVSPADEDLDATMPNGSVGARFIVEAANSLGSSEVPLVVINGGTLTDVADAYLLDPSVSERLVVVGSVGQASEDGAFLGGPNGELDTWAGTIVAQRLRLVQVSAFYEHADDVPEGRADQLPTNPFGDWMKGKIGEISNPYAADQAALLAVTLPGFALDASRVGFTGRNPQGEAVLEFQEDGCCWFVSAGDGARAAEFLWEMLDDPNTFSQ